MRILIDTNILIHLEDNKVIEKEFSEIYNIALLNKCEVLYHKACLEDIKRDKDEKRKKIISSKLAKYIPLESPAEMDEGFSNLVSEKNENDKIDNLQLLQLFKGYVEIFITNDKGIKKKAKKIGCADKVLNAEEAYSLLSNKYTLEYPEHPILNHESVRNLTKFFNSNFFNSLKSDYDQKKFMEWIEKCARENRKCYNLQIDGDLSALLIYNKESKVSHNLNGINEDVIKICTLKVSDDALGMKLGELFINKIFRLCLNQNICYLYITTYAKQKALIYLLEKFGFDLFDQFINEVGNEERIYIKRLKQEEQKRKYDSKLHPYYRDNVKKYVVPIRKKYYSSLFKDSNLRERTLFDAVDYGLQEVQGNTIIKAYVSKSSNQQLKENDLLFFYSSGDYKSIEPVGVLIDHRRVENFEALWELVKNKTVYTQEDLKKKFEGRKYLTVTIFRLVDYLKPIIGFNELKELDCFGTKFQTFTKMSDKDYNLIKTKYLDESLIVN